MKSSFYIKLSNVALAVLDLTALSEDTFYINRINVPKAFRGNKIGTNLLEECTREADKFGVILELHPNPSDGLSCGQLESWYHKHGFNWELAQPSRTDTTESVMRRNPKMKKEELGK